MCQFFFFTFLCINILFYYFLVASFFLYIYRVCFLVVICGYLNSHCVFFLFSFFCFVGSFLFVPEKLKQRAMIFVQILIAIKCSNLPFFAFLLFHQKNRQKISFFKALSHPLSPFFLSFFLYEN